VTGASGASAVSETPTTDASLAVRGPGDARVTVTVRDELPSGGTRGVGRPVTYARGAAEEIEARGREVSALYLVNDKMPSRGGLLDSGSGVAWGLPSGLFVVNNPKLAAR
jgi:hypothetical protein